jgi:hypothetical protein
MGQGDEFRFDSVMPAQFYPPRRRPAEFEPIMRLMGAILIDAVRCFQNNFEAYLPSAQNDFREARFWIFDNKADGPFSFVSVCDALQIERFDPSLEERNTSRRQAANNPALAGQHSRANGPFQIKQEF